MADSSQTKSEAASPRRRQESRQQGQVPTSTDFASGIILFSMMWVLTFASYQLGGELLTLIGSDLPSAVIRQTWSVQQTVDLGWTGSMFIIRAAMAILAGSVLVAVFSHVMQIGFQITPQSLAWKPTRLSPASGAKKIFSMRGVMRTLMAVAKFIACAAAIMGTWYAKRELLTAQYPTLFESVAATWGDCLYVSTMGALALVAVGCVDLAFQRWQHEQDLKMSHQELKQETKENEGDAQVKGRIRKLQREALQHRSLNQVPSATVVITNPTHFAVAIRYDRETMPAPRVVAKGKGILAQRIKKIASESGVPQIERKSVARALYASTEVGSEIPTNLYRAVAEILAHVYGLKR